MFDLFSDAAKVAAQMEIISSEYGFALWETLYSLALEVLFAYVVGLPLGVLLVTGESDGIRPLPGGLMKIINVIVNLLRSVPFLILMIMVLPLSKIILGTSIGTPASGKRCTPRCCPPCLPMLSACLWACCWSRARAMVSVPCPAD